MFKFNIKEQGGNLFQNGQDISFLGVFGGFFGRGFVILSRFIFVEGVAVVVIVWLVSDLPIGSIG